jgi:hypothetical protein
MPRVGFGPTIPVFERAKAFNALGLEHTPQHRSYDVRTVHVASSSRMTTCDIYRTTVREQRNVFGRSSVKGKSYGKKKSYDIFSYDRCRCVCSTARPLWSAKEDIKSTVAETDIRRVVAWKNKEGWEKAWIHVIKNNEKWEKMAKGTRVKTNSEDL